MADAIHDLTAPYALDALDEGERAAFEAHLATCEECREELRGFWGVTGGLAHAVAGPPPPLELRDRVLAAARAERNVVQLPRRRAVTFAAAAAAVAAVAAVGLGIWSVSLARELDRTRSAADDRAAALAVLADPASRRVALTTPHGNLVVGADGRAALVLVDVPAAPAGKVYEVWVVEDGVPHAAGLFEGAPSRAVVPVEHPVEPGDVVAITLEDAGGASAPEGPQVTVTPRV